MSEHGSIYTSKAPIDVACLALATLWSHLRSKDPNTQVGACVYHGKSGALFLGYNGFPSGIPDLKAIWDQRDKGRSPNKYEYCVHAEVAAIRKAFAVFSDLSDCALFITHFPCRHCMKDVIIPSGLKYVIYMSSYPPDSVSEELASVAGIELRKSDVDFYFADASKTPWTQGSKKITITNPG